MDKALFAFAVAIVFWCIGEGIVKIIRASNGSEGGKAFRKKLDALESGLADVEQDLEDSNKRIEVLERIVTDDGRNLRRQIDELG